MLYTCSAEDRSLLSELKKASLNNAEQLDRFFSCLIDQMGASSASDMVQRVLGGSGLAVCFCCNTADQIPDSDYALVNSLPNLRQTRLLKWKNTNKSSKFWRQAGSTFKMKNSSLTSMIDLPEEDSRSRGSTISTKRASLPSSERPSSFQIYG